MSTIKHILIAEDDEFLRFLLLAKCRSVGMQVESVSNGEQLVSEALSYQYDILITDIQMPVCDGIQAMQILRRLGYDRPIFAMSADPITEPGFDQMLQKPVDMQLLAQLVLQTSAKKRIPLVIDEQLTTLFYQNLHQLSQAFSAALQNENTEQMRQICHKVKGGASSFGLTDLATLADQLQTQLSLGLMPANTQLCQSFDAMLHQLGAGHERH